MARLFQRDALSMIDKLIPNFRFLGAAFWAAWQFVLYGCEIVFCGVSLNSSEVAMVYVATSLPFALTIVIVGGLHRRVFDLLGKSSFMVSMGIVGSAGTVLIFVLLPLGSCWYLAGAVLAGMGTALIACRSILQFAELGPREAIFMAALVQLAAIAINYTVISVAAVVRTWLFFALPTIAALLLLVEVNEDRPHIPDDGWEIPRWFWRFVVGVFFLAIPVSICRACFPLYALGDGGSGALIDNRRMSGVLIILFMLVLLFIVLRMPKRLRYGIFMYRVMLVASATYVLLGMFGPQSEIVLGLSGAVNAILSLCVWVLLARIAFSSGASALRMFGLGYSSFTVGGVVGWGVGLAAEKLDLPLDAVVTVLMASAIAVLFVMLFLFRPSDLGRMMLPIHESDGDQESASGGTHVALGSEPSEKDALSGEPDHAQAVVAEESAHAADVQRSASEEVEGFSAWRAACALVAQRSQLTSREVEVFDMLVRGFSPRAISEELCISYNTARNHTQRIYAKCGVHGKDELQSYIRSFEPEQ